MTAGAIALSGLKKVNYSGVGVVTSFRAETDTIEGIRHPIDTRWHMTLRVPARWTGSIYPFLILADVRGSGRIDIWNQSFPIGSDILNTRIQSWKRFITRASLSVDQSAELDYLINQKIFYYRKTNTPVQVGKDLPDREIKITEAATQR